MCKLPEQVQAESLYCGWNFHFLCIWKFWHPEHWRAKNSSCTCRGGEEDKRKKSGDWTFSTGLFSVFVPIYLCSNIFMWHFGKYRCIIHADSFVCLKKAFVFGKFDPIYSWTFLTTVYFFSCCFSNLLVGQRDTVLTLPWSKKLLEFQLAGLFSNFFPWLLGHAANFMQLLCFSQKTGTFCGEREVCPLYILFILYLRSPWGRMFYITS